MAAVLGPGAHQQLAVVGHLGVGGPDLRPGDHVVVAVTDGPGAHGGQVTAGVGLGESLAPHLVPPEDRGQVPPALLGGALGDDGRPGMEEADEVDPDVGGVGPLELLFEDELLDRRRTPAAALHRPVDPGVAGLEQQRAASGCRRRGVPASRSAPASAGGRAVSRPARARSSLRNACSASV